MRSSGDHPSPSDLARFLRGELPRGEVRAVVRHLLTNCPRCLKVTGELWRERQTLSLASPVEGEVSRQRLDRYRLRRHLEPERQTKGDDMTKAKAEQAVLLRIFDELKAMPEKEEMGVSAEVLKPPASLKKKVENLLRETLWLRDQVLAFRRSAEDILGPLDALVSGAEAEAMVTPRANILGTLENLLNQDLDDLLRQLDELRGHLESQAGRSS